MSMSKLIKGFWGGVSGVGMVVKKAPPYITGWEHTVQSL